MTKYFCMLAQSFDKHGHKIDYPAFITPKLDGVRGCFRQGTDRDEGGATETYHFYSRNGKKWNDNVVQHLLDELRDWVGDFQGAWLDGEFFVEGWTRNQINSAIGVRRKEPKDETALIEFHVFDMNIDAPYYQRLNALQSHGGRITPFCPVVEVYPVDTMDEARELQSKFEAMGYEGAMIRQYDAMYELKRSYGIQKLKSFEDAEFECVGVEEGRDEEHSVGGRLHGTLGKIVLYNPASTKKDKTFKCGSGFDDATRHAIWSDPSMVIGKQITVKYFQINEYGNPEFPIFQCIRSGVE